MGRLCQRIGLNDLLTKLRMAGFEFEADFFLSMRIYNTVANRRLNGNLRWYRHEEDPDWYTWIDWSGIRDNIKVAGWQMMMRFSKAYF